MTLLALRSYEKTTDFLWKKNIFPNKCLEIRAIVADCHLLSFYYYLWELFRLSLSTPLNWLLNWLLRFKFNKRRLSLCL